MLSSLLITLREGLEAALIIGIILAYLVKTDNRQSFKSVWLGVIFAVVVSVITGAALYIIAGEFTGVAEEIFEGIAMLAAVGVLTWMIFWMRRQAVNIKGHLHTRVQSLLTGGSSFGLIALSFIVVVREGIETALFLFAATRVTESPLMATLGGLVGLVVAVVLGYGIYRGSSRLNLRMFFNVTSVVLIFFAAGLLAHGIHEFHEAGIIPPVIEHVWDINHILPEKAAFGQFLTAILGYNGNPSLVEVISYSLYLVVALLLYFTPHGRVKITTGSGKSARLVKETV